MYRLLLARSPGRPGIGARIAEIEQLMQEGRAPLPGEHTVQRDISKLREAPEARGSIVGPFSAGFARTELPPPGEIDDLSLEEPTLIGRRPVMDDADGLDPLAQTGLSAAPTRIERRPIGLEGGPDTDPGWDTEPPPAPEAGESDVVTVHRIVPVG
jgi:hypothetical protein